MCRGSSTLMRNILCSSFSGRAKPLIMLWEERETSHVMDRFFQFSNKRKTASQVCHDKKSGHTHLPKISKSSAIPLWCSVSYINLQCEIKDIDSMDEFWRSYPSHLFSRMPNLADSKTDLLLRAHIFCLPLKSL